MLIFKNFLYLIKITFFLQVRACEWNIFSSTVDLSYVCRKVTHNTPHTQNMEKFTIEVNTKNLCELNITVYTPLMVYVLLSVVEISQFYFPTIFLIKVFCCVFFTLCIPCWGQSKNPKVILHQIIGVYPCDDFMNKGMSIFHKIDL